MNKLKPCPFCGGETKQRLSVGSWVECKKCGVKTPEYQFDNQSIDAWNRRSDGWIPISERWPSKNGHYITTYREWTDGNYLPQYDNTYIKILRYHKAIFKMPICVDKKAEEDTHREVIAWMPLPEPHGGNTDGQ